MAVTKLKESISPGESELIKEFQLLKSMLNDMSAEELVDDLKCVNDKSSSKDLNEYFEGVGKMFRNVSDFIRVAARNAREKSDHSESLKKGSFMTESYGDTKVRGHVTTWNIHKTENGEYLVKEHGEFHFQYSIVKIVRKNM